MGKFLKFVDSHSKKYARTRVFTDPNSPLFFLIRENTSQSRTVFSHISCSVSYYSPPLLHFIFRVKFQMCLHPSNKTLPDKFWSYWISVTLILNHFLPFSQRSKSFFTLSWRRSLTYKNRSICSANQRIGLYMIRVSFMKVLERFNFLINIKTQIIYYIYYYMTHYATARGAYTLHSKANPLKLAKFVLFWIAEIVIQINLVNQKTQEMNFILLNL